MLCTSWYKIEVLMAYSKQKSDSLHMFIIFNISLKKQNRNNSLLSSLSIEYIFLFIEITYLIMECIILWKEISYLLTALLILTLIV